MISVQKSRNNIRESVGHSALSFSMRMKGKYYGKEENSGNSNGYAK